MQRRLLLIVANRSAVITTFSAPTAKGADTSRILQGSPKVDYIAWRLAGEADLDLRVEAEAARTDPACEF